MIARSLPTHLDLPESDGAILDNTFQHPQAEILSQSIEPVLDGIHQDGRYFLGTDTGIYFKITDPPLLGCRAPDWFYVPNVDRMVGEYRRSYVLWIEKVSPRIVMEFVSTPSGEELDRTPETGKFWIYERLIQAEYYVIYEPERERVEAYCRRRGRYVRVRANSRGHVPIANLNLELGIHRGDFRGHVDFPWLRWFDANGCMVPHGLEREGRAVQRAKELAARLRALGVDPDQD